MDGRTPGSSAPANEKEEEEEKKGEEGALVQKWREETRDAPAQAATHTHSVRLFFLLLLLLPSPRPTGKTPAPPLYTVHTVFLYVGRHSTPPLTVYIWPLSELSPELS